MRVTVTFPQMGKEVGIKCFRENYKVVHYLVLIDLSTQN